MCYIIWESAEGNEKFSYSEWRGSRIVPRIAHDNLKRFTKAIFSATGSEGDEAELVAGSLVGANLAGVDSHGVIRIPQYVKMIEKGELKVNVLPRIKRETKATARIDGRRGFGQVTGTEAMKLAIKKARSLGVGIVTSYNTNHVGRLVDFSILAATQDMIGIFAAK